MMVSDGEPDYSLCEPDPADFPCINCHDCSGVGMVCGGDGEEYTCRSCGGSGWQEGEHYGF